MNSTKFCHIELSVSNYSKSIIFYDKVLFYLGWKRLSCMKSWTAYSDGQLKLVLCPTAPQFVKIPFHRKQTGLNHLAFYAESKKQVDEFYAEVLKKNAIPTLYHEGPEGDDEYYAVFFEDPDRIKLEVVFAPHYCQEDAWPNNLENDFDPYQG